MFLPFGEKKASRAKVEMPRIMLFSGIEIRTEIKGQFREITAIG
jgi:hypothetical protein